MFFSFFVFIFAVFFSLFNYNSHIPPSATPPPQIQNSPSPCFSTSHIIMVISRPIMTVFIQLDDSTHFCVQRKIDSGKSWISILFLRDSGFKLIDNGFKFQYFFQQYQRLFRRGEHFIWKPRTPHVNQHNSSTYN